MLPELFEKVVGRAPSDEERNRLVRLQEVTRMRDNDAFGVIVVTLEEYNGLFAEYPKKIATETMTALSEARIAMAQAAKLEATKAQRTLVEHVANASLELSNKLASKRFVLREALGVLGLLVAFGTVCMVSGYNLGTSSTPFWVSRDFATSGTGRLLATIFSAPAGWMMFLLLLPLAVHGARAGWTLARDDEQAPVSRAFGWMLVGASAVGALGALVILGKFA